MDLKDETDGLDENNLKNVLFQKTTTLKTNFGCESYALLKKGINGNRRTTWKVEVGPRDDTPH
jgi:hypothetical protein